MFNFFKKKNRLTTYEQPVLMANSTLPGFWDFVKLDSKFASPTETLPWIKLIDESEIPYGQLYFKYIGDGRCKRAMKHDPLPQGKLDATLSLEMRNSIDNHVYGVDNFSGEYTRNEMFGVCFHLRNEIAGS